MAKNDNLYKSTAQDVAEAPKQTPATPTQPTSNVTNAQRADGAIDMNAVQAGARIGRQAGIGATPISEQVQAGSPQDNREHQGSPQETNHTSQPQDGNTSFLRNNVDNIQFTQSQVQQPQEQQTPLQQSYRQYTQNNQLLDGQRQSIRYRDDAKRLEDESNGQYLNTRNGFLAKRAGDFLKQYEKQGQTIDDGMKRQAVEEAIKATGGKIADDADWANTINDIVGRVNSQYTFSNTNAKTLQQLPTADDMMAWYEQGKLGNTHINLIKDANPQLYNEFMQKKQAHDKAQEMASYATDLHETYRDLDESVVDAKGKQIRYTKKTLDNPLEQMEQSIITYLNQEGGLATQANLKTMSQITDTDEIRRLTKEVNELTNRYEEIEDKKFDMLDDIRNKQGIDAFDARIIMADHMRSLTREQTLIQRQHRLVAGDLQVLKNEAIEGYQLQMQQLDRNERMRSQRLGEMFQVYGLLQNKQQRQDAQKAQQAELEVKQQQLQREEQRRQIDREDKLFYYQADQAFKVAQVQSQRERDLKINQLARSHKREDTYLQHELEIEKYGIKNKLDLQTKKELLQREYDHPGQQMYSDGDGNYMFYNKNTGEIGKIGNVLDHVSDARTAGEANAGYTSGGASYKTPTGNWAYKYNPQSGEFAAIRNGKVTTGSYLDTIGRKTMMAGGKATNIVGKKGKNGRWAMYSHWKVGIDVDGSTGDPIPTAVSGTVTLGNDPNGFGKHVKVKTDDGYTVYYSHLSQHNLKNGDRVNAGDLVGLMGNTGGVYGTNGKRPGPNDKETGSHLDISIRKPNGARMEVNEAMAFVNNRAKTAHQSGWNSEQSIQTRAAQGVMEEMEFDDADTNKVRSWSKQKQARYSAYVTKKKELSQQQAQAEATVKQNDRVMYYTNQISSKSPQVKEYIAASNMFARVEAAYYGEHTAASDMAMIFAFMKVLDPTSVVRESEQAQAQDAAGVPDRVRNAYNNALSGKRLSQKQRKEFFEQAQGLVANLEKNTEGSIALYKQSMEAEGIDPDLVFNTFKTTEGYNSTSYQSVMQTPDGGQRKAVGNGVYAEVAGSGKMYLVRGTTKQPASLLDLQAVGLSAAQVFDMTRPQKVSAAQTSVLDRLGY